MKLLPIIITSIVIYQASLYSFKKHAPFFTKRITSTALKIPKTQLFKGSFKKPPFMKPGRASLPFKTPSLRFFSSMPFQGAYLRKPSFWRNTFDHLKKHWTLKNMALLGSSAAIFNLPSNILNFIKKEIPDLYEKAIKNPELFPIVLNETNVAQMLDSDDQTKWLIQHIKKDKDPARYLTLIRTIAPNLSIPKQTRLIQVLDTLAQYSSNQEDLHSVASVILDYNLIHNPSPILPKVIDAILSDSDPSILIKLEQQFFSVLEKTGITHTTLNPYLIHQFQLRNIPRFRKLFQENKKEALEKIMSFPIDVAIKMLYVIVNPLDKRTSKEKFTVFQKNYNPGYMDEAEEARSFIRRYFHKNKEELLSQINNITDSELKEQVNQLYERLNTKKSIQNVFKNYINDQIFNSPDQLFKGSYYQGLFKRNLMQTFENRKF